MIRKTGFIAILLALTALLAAATSLLTTTGGGPRTYFVAVDGRADAAGTRADPWSIEHGFDARNLAVGPSDVVEIGPGTYHSAGAEFTPARSGTAGQPVTYRATPGTVTLDASLPVQRWHPVSLARGRNIWESDAAISPKGYLGGAIWIDAQWWPLMPARRGDMAQLTATDDSYDPKGLYYPGPMIVAMPDGRVRIRLDPPSAQAMLGQKIARVASTDPNANRIALSAGNAVIANAASHVVFDGLTLTGGFTSYGNAAPVSDVTLRNGRDTPFYDSFNLGNAREGLIDGWTSDGGMRSGWWISYADIKGGVTAAEGVRKVAVRTGKPGQSSGWQIRRSTFANFFDGMLGSGTDYEIGGGSDTATAWAMGNRFVGIWDDAIQLNAGNQGWHIHHNHLLGAGISRDGFASGRDWGNRWPVIDHNIIDPRGVRIFYGRGGARDADDGRPWAGFRSPATLSSHGIRSGPDARAFPFALYANTFVFADPSIGAGDLVLLTTDTDGEGINLIANNVFVTDGPMPWLARDAWLARNRDRVIGNLFVKPDGFDIANSAWRPLFRYIHDDHGLIADQTGGNGWNDPPGFEGTGAWARSNKLVRSTTAGAISAEWLPKLDEIARGAADLSASGLPFTHPAVPWRGALAPVR